MKDLAIIIPAYKADYLRQALDSLVRQTSKRFHVYICDDCSPYDLEAIVKEYEGKFPLSYHRFSDNLGSKDLVGQWKRSIECSGNEKWIWLFSDDDILEENCVASFYLSMEQHPKAELFHFNLKILDEFKNGKISVVSPYPQRLKAGEYLEAKLRGKLISYVVEFVFSRDLYNRVGGFVNYDLAWGSDFMTWLYMASETEEGIVSIDYPQTCVIWRRSSQNISPDRSRPILLRKLKALIGNAAFIKTQLKSNPEKYYPLKYSFRWIRFPIGEIWRNRGVLTNRDLFGLILRYIKEVLCKYK